MSVLWILVGFSILVAAGFLVLFIWAVRSGQYDDNYTPSVRMLFEDRFGNHPSNTNAEGYSTHGNGNHKVR